MDEEKKPKVTIADIAAQGAANAAPSTESSEQTENASIPAGQPLEQKTDYVFFNVMPKIKDAATMTQPTLKVEHSVEPVSTAPSFFTKYKIYILCVIALLILGPLGYFLVGKFGGSSYKPVDLLINNSGSNSNKTPSTASSTQSSQKNFTTPQAWRDKYFPGCTDQNVCGDNADPDQDGLTNIQELKYKSDPNNPDSDKDGISDGDEVNIFSSDPLNSHTGNDPQYSDSDYIKGGYDLNTGKKVTPQQVATITAKMRNFGLHQPTLTTLGDTTNTLYNFSTGTASSTTGSLVSTSTLVSLSTSTATSTLDQTLGAKQDRDTQRSSTIKNIESALIKYKSDNQIYPQTNDFATMFADIKPYLKVATNPLDPVNKNPYIYSYISNAGASDFSLTFFSEVAGQPISKNSSEAQKDTASEQAGIYDDQRQGDLESIRSALLLYSQNNIAGNQTYVFPASDKYKTALVPTYLEVIPKDPKTGQDYQYQVSATFNTFTLKAVLDSPPTGTTGYLCNQDECVNY